MNQTNHTPKEPLNILTNQYINDRKLKSFIFPLTKKTIHEKIITNVKTKDFHIVAIREEEHCPQFFYTIGLFYHYQHPELMIMGVNANLACDIFWKAHALIKSGGAIQPWTNLPTDMTQTPMKSVPIDANNYTQFLGFGMWFYRSLGHSRPDTFPAIQLVWPDVWNKIYPWEAGYDKGFFDAQTVLCSDQALKQELESSAVGESEF